MASKSGGRNDRNDDGREMGARCEVAQRTEIAREDLKTAASPRAVALTHRLAVRDVAPRPVTTPDSVRSNEEKVRWRDEFVRERTFDRSLPRGQDLPRCIYQKAV